MDRELNHLNPKRSQRRGLPGLVLLSVLTVLLLAGSYPATAADDWTWIWTPEPTRPPETLYFRQKFRLARVPLSAKLFITADNSYIAYLNERSTPIAAGNDWTTVQEFDVTRFLKAGDNLLAVQCRNTGGLGGLLYKLVIKETAAHNHAVYSDGRVKVSRHPPIAWMGLALDDGTWPAAREVAPAGGGVWGRLRGAPTSDYGRFVRVWDIHAGGAPGADPYARPRAPGERMLMSASVASATDMQILAGAGFTLFQTDSDHLSTEETASNRWDWQRADAARALVQKLGLDWSYFEHEAFPPPWYRSSVPFTRIRALDDHQSLAAFSPWEARWPAFVDAGYRSLAREFGPVAAPLVAPVAPDGVASRPKVSALIVGVHGDYGEAGMPMGARLSVPGQREDWLRRFGDDNDHLAFWCDDPDARADFRAAMLKLYGSLDALNAVWRTNYRTPGEINFPHDVDEQPSAAGRRQYLDFMAWYRNGMGRAVEINLSAARKSFPDTLLMLPAGYADENVRGGNDNSLIPKLAARYGATVRSTHGGFKPFADNAATMLGRLGSASRFYGAPFWTEPPGVLTPEQTVARIFEAASQGSTGYFDWASNAVANRDVYYRYAKYLRVDKPVVDVAMFYPARAQSIRPDQGYASTFARACTYLRDIANYDIVDDTMVMDGCLSRYRILALWEGTVCDPETLDKIKNWVDGGGVLMAYDFGKVTTFTGDTTWFKDLYGYVQDLTPAHVTERYVGTVPALYSLEIGRMSAADYLDGVWYEPSIEHGVSRRWSGAEATVKLPVNPDKRYALIVHAVVPLEAQGLRHEALLNGHKLGDLSSLGDATYRFLIPEDMLDNGSLATFTFRSETFQPAKAGGESKDTRELGVQVQSVSLVEIGADEIPDAPPPPGAIRREVDLSHLAPSASNDSWVRRYGNGLTFYFPASRTLLKGYIEVLRRAIYHLSAIDPARRDALPIDVAADGVYATLFPDKLLYYNSLDIPVTKKVTIPAAAFASWEHEVATPEETTWTLDMKPHSIEAISLVPSPQELLYECEAFTELGGLKPIASPDCSPGEGLSAVRVPAGGAIATRFRVTVAGRYNVFVRCLHNTGLEPVDLLIDGQLTASGGQRIGQTLLAGAVALMRGTHTLTLRARPGRPVRADFVLLSNDPTIAGYDFATRTAPVE